MRISFDLDDTLICVDESVPREPRPLWYRRLLASSEPLRRGACELIDTLRQSGWEIWIYTTSYRSNFAIRRWLKSYGMKLDGVVNQQRRNQRMIHITGKMPSKNPAAFGIDLHVDDSEGVRIEGNQFGFQVVVVNKHDNDWTEIVLDAASRLEVRRRSENAPVR